MNQCSDSTACGVISKRIPGFQDVHADMGFSISVNLGICVRICCNRPITRRSSVTVSGTLQLSTALTRSRDGIIVPFDISRPTNFRVGTAMRTLSSVKHHPVSRQICSKFRRIVKVFIEFFARLLCRIPCEAEVIDVVRETLLQALV